MKGLRIKFIAVAAAAQISVLLALLITLNVIMTQSSAERAEAFGQELIENDGTTQNPVNYALDGRADDGVPAVSFFSVKLNPNGEVISINISGLPDFTKEIAMEYLGAARSIERDEGVMPVLGSFRFFSVEKPYGELFVFYRRSIERIMLWELLRVSSSIVVVTVLVVFLLSVFFSKWVTAPVIKSFESQQSFISDASHELKTPLAILNTAVSLLETEMGGDKRIDMMKSQVWRLNDLVTDMLTLSRSDEKIGSSIFSKGRKKIRHTSLSDGILTAATEFESRAFEEGKLYNIDVKRGLRLNIDEVSAQRLVRILVDNAIKYSDDGGRIELSLQAVNSHPVLSVFNTGCGIPEDERKKVFERFYRSDKSRSRETGGFGLGLSIAKAIADGSGSKISVDGVTGEWVRLTVTF